MIDYSENDEWSSSSGGRNYLDENTIKVVKLLMGHPAPSTPRQSNMTMSSKSLLGDKEERKKGHYNVAFASYLGKSSPLLMANREK
eukprot:6372215-Ditylum_brightwellii.AAC.1